MRHARPDYNRIQDPAGLIPEDEPVFLLRSTDMLAPMIVKAWAMQAKANGVQPELVALADKHADDMLAYQKKHGRKLPDMPEGPFLYPGEKLKMKPEPGQ